MKSKLPSIMKEKGLSVRSLATIASVSPVTIHKAKYSISECGLTSLKKIADALDIKVSELFEES